jgi:hypothetical protein
MKINPGLHFDAILNLHFPMDALMATNPECAEAEANFPSDWDEDAELEGLRHEEEEARRLGNEEMAADALIDDGIEWDHGPSIQETAYDTYCQSLNH